MIDVNKACALLHKKTKYNYFRWILEMPDLYVIAELSNDGQVPCAAPFSVNKRTGRIGVHSFLDYHDDDPDPIPLEVPAQYRFPGESIIDGLTKKKNPYYTGNKTK